MADFVFSRPFLTQLGAPCPDKLLAAARSNFGLWTTLSASTPRITFLLLSLSLSLLYLINGDWTKLAQFSFLLLFFRIKLDGRGGKYQMRLAGVLFRNFLSLLLN